MKLCLSFFVVKRKKKERIAESSIIDHRLILMAYESVAIEDQSINTDQLRKSTLFGVFASRSGRGALTYEAVG